MQKIDLSDRATGGKDAKTFLILFMIPFFSFQLGCRADKGLESRREDLRTDVAAINAMIERWVELYNRSDDEKIVSELYADDAVQMPPNDLIRKGKTEILQGYRESRKRSFDICEMSIAEDIRISGNLAVARGYDTGSFAPYDGGRAGRYSIKWTIVLSRQPDGSWKWINEIWNDNDPIPSFAAQW